MAVTRVQAAHSSAARGVAGAHFSSRKGRAAGWPWSHAGEVRVRRLPPKVFGEASPQTGRAGTRRGVGPHPPPQTISIVQDLGGSDMASGPQPRRTPTFKYSLRTGEGSQLLFLRN